METEDAMRAPILLVLVLACGGNSPSDLGNGNGNGEQTLLDDGSACNISSECKTGKCSTAGKCGVMQSSVLDVLKGTWKGRIYTYTVQSGTNTCGSGEEYIQFFNPQDYFEFCLNPVNGNFHYEYAGEDGFSFNGSFYRCHPERATAEEDALTSQWQVGPDGDCLYTDQERLGFCTNFEWGPNNPLAFWQTRRAK